MNFEKNLAFQRQAEKKESLYEKVEMKTQLILAFRRMVEENGNLSTEDLAAKLHAGLEDVKKKLGTEKIAQYALLLENMQRNFEIKERIYEIDNELYPEIYIDDDDEGEDDANQAIEGSDLSDEEIKAQGELGEELEMLSGESENLEREIHNSLMDNDISFLLKLVRFYESIIRKKKRTLKLLSLIREKQAHVLRSLFNGYKFEKDPIVMSTGVCINIILSPKDYEALYGGNSNGVHITTGEPINVIRDRIGKESTIMHEENHNISESFAPSAFLIDSFIKKLEKEMSYIDDGDYPDFFIDRAKQGIENGITEYYKQNYYEIIADIDRLPEGDTSTFMSNYSQTENKLKQFASGVKDEKFRSRLHQRIDDMEKNFLIYFNNLSNIFYAANKIGRTEEAKALMILFGKGDGSRKIERHLRNYDQKYDDHVLIRRFTGEGDYMKAAYLKENYTKGVKTIEDILLSKIFGPAEDRRTKVLIETGIGIDDLEDLERIESLIDSIADEDQKQAIINRLQQMKIDDFKEIASYDFANKKLMITWKLSML